VGEMILNHLIFRSYRLGQPSSTGVLPGTDRRPSGSVGAANYTCEFLSRRCPRRALSRAAREHTHVRTASRASRSYIDPKSPADGTHHPRLATFVHWGAIQTVLRP